MRPVGHSHRNPYACPGSRSHPAPACAQRHRSLKPAVLPLCYRRLMAVRKKRSISLPPDLDDQIAAAAEQAGMTYSAWLAATARKEFTLRAGLAAVTAWERDHGAFTADELADADAWADQAAGRASGTPARKTA
jgi:hypothetical protein